MIKLCGLTLSLPEVWALCCPGPFSNVVVRELFYIRPEKNTVIKFEKINEIYCEEAL